MTNHQQGRRIIPIHVAVKRHLLAWIVILNAIGWLIGYGIGTVTAR